MTTTETTALKGRAYDKVHYTDGSIGYHPNPDLAYWSPDMYTFAAGWTTIRINRFLRDREAEAYDAYQRHANPTEPCPGCGTTRQWHDPHCRYLRWTQLTREA